MTLRDAARLTRFRNGDPAAFREIYELYAPRVMGYLTRLTGNQGDAEDLLQEVFVAAHQGRESYAGRGQFITWLLGIASRRWRDRNRRMSVNLAGSVDSGDGHCEIPHPGRALEDRVIDSLTLDDALRRLGPTHREALLLVAGQGLTYAEAAAVTGEPVGTVKWRVAVATRAVRQTLSAAEQEDVHGAPAH